MRLRYRSVLPAVRRIWVPRIGEEAAATLARAIWFARLGVCLEFIWCALTIWLQLIDETGGPIVAAFVLLFLPANALIIRRLLLGARASWQASLTLDVVQGARPPLSSTAAFDRWYEKYSTQSR